MTEEAPTLAIERAGRWLQGAKRAMEDGRWDDVVYSSQMTVEHSVKSVLMALGIHFSKRHDVSDLLLGISGRSEIPEWFRLKIPEISDAVARLAEQRGLASYGFQVGIGAEYFREFAPEALREAEQVRSLCLKLLNQLLVSRSTTK